MTAVLLALALALPAQAAPADTAAQSLRRDPVYVDAAAARTISPADGDRLRDRIREGGRAVFVAVLPASEGDPSAVAADLRRRVGLAGTYGVAAGDRFGAASDTL